MKKRGFRELFKEIRLQEVIIRPYSGAFGDGAEAVTIVKEVDRPVIVPTPRGSLKVCDAGFIWYQLALRERFFWLSAAFDEKARLIELYFDITAGNDFTDPAEPFFRDMYLDVVVTPEGTIRVLDEDELEAAFESGEISHAFGDTAFASAAQEAEQLEPGEALTKFELKCDNAVTEMLTEAKKISFGAGPVIAYLAAQEQEISSVRMILTGKLSGIATEKIRERLRESYA